MAPSVVAKAAEKPRTDTGDMALTIDVVVPVRDRWDLTERCLTLLQDQSAHHSVMVADNGSTDGTPQKVRERFPEVQVIELETNRGFAAACNAGAVAGSGDIIVLLNNDVEAPPDFIAELVRPFSDDAGVGSAAACLVRPDGEMIDSVGVTADRTLAGFPRLRGRPLSEAASPRPVLSGPCGAAGAYRRAAWEEVEGLDEGVLFYGEDVDLALRTRSAGWDTVAVVGAVGVHLGSATFGPRSPWQRYQGGFARGYFLRRYGVLRTPAAPRALATEAIVVAGDAVISRDLSALRGRAAGWRSARWAARRPSPPRESFDPTIGFCESLLLRREVYAT